VKEVEEDEEEVGDIEDENEEEIVDAADIVVVVVVVVVVVESMKEIVDLNEEAVMFVCYSNPQNASIQNDHSMEGECAFLVEVGMVEMVRDRGHHYFSQHLPSFVVFADEL
jgi:hypothetical protein